MLPSLDPYAIEIELGRLHATVGRPLSIAPVTGSTNDDARAAALAGAPSGSAFLAEAQTSGRGRRGHTWHSPPAENLYVSLLARPSVSPDAVSAVTLAVGVALARVLEAELDGRAPVWVKWPNDVLAGPSRRKLAGVLVEGQIRGRDVASLVVGVGVNVHAKGFPEGLRDIATSLAMLGASPDRSLLAARVLAAIGVALERFERDRLASFMQDLATLDGLRGTAVEVSGVRGTAVGVDDGGRLLVRSSEGVTAVVAGEVSLS